MFDVNAILKKVNQEKFSIIAIRHLSPDEKYEIGDICRNSYDWDYELDCSTYETENPIELDGTCGYAVYDLCNLDLDEMEEAEQLLSMALKEADYIGEPVLIAGHGYTYGNDENEVIIKDAEVIGKDVR